MVRIGDLVRAWWSNRFRPGRGLDDLAERVGLSAEALQAFAPSYHEVFIPKRAGGQRRLLVPDGPTKALQRVLLERVLGKLRAHEAACGFERGRSIAHNALTHAGRAVVLRLDVVDFFPTTRSDRLQGYFRAIGWSAAAAQVLVRLTTHEGGLPQGAPTSPRLSNLVNRPLDVRLTNLAAKYRARYTALRRRHHVFVSEGLSEAHAGAGAAGARDPQRPGLHAPPRQEAEHAPPPPAAGGHRAGRERAAAIAPRLRRRLRAVEHRLRIGRAATLTPEQLAGWRSLEAMIEKQCRPAE